MIAHRDWPVYFVDSGEQDDELERRELVNLAGVLSKCPCLSPEAREWLIDNREALSNAFCFIVQAVDGTYMMSAEEWREHSGKPLHEIEDMVGDYNGPFGPPG